MAQLCIEHCGQFRLFCRQVPLLLHISHQVEEFERVVIVTADQFVLASTDGTARAVGLVESVMRVMEKQRITIRFFPP